jgi:hypothetical protein
VVIVDLARLKFVDASGPGALMLAREHARRPPVASSCWLRHSGRRCWSRPLRVSPMCCPSTLARKMRPGSRNSRGQPPRSPLVRLCLR